MHYLSSETQQHYNREMLKKAKTSGYNKENYPLNKTNAICFDKKV